MKPSDDTIVRLRGVRRDYGETLAAVNGVDLDVARGQILTILGPSGCGKTTLLRLIAGFERPDAGSIEIDGRLVADRSTFVPPEARRVGMVFQQHALFPHLTVAENIAFGLPRLGTAERASRIQHLLNLIRLPKAHGRFPHELSGGQQQRVAVARALAPEPVIVLMDEPFSNLDADIRKKIRDEVRFILRQAGTTVVFVTHDQEEALFMGDRLAVMKGGSLVQLGQPEAVFQAPGSTFIAEFLGQAEFLPAAVGPDELQTEIGSLGQVVDLPLGSDVLVGFRADDLAFEPDPQGKAILLARFFQGAVCQYRIRLPSGRIVHSMQPHYRDYQPGTLVRVWFAPQHPLPCFADGQAVTTWLANAENERLPGAPARP
ncbi:MAG TPA: ABC transporter ATP-binding protein [Anaerolineales bacterium]|jgi:iron(III) transport system ATP-binding protein